MLHRSVVQCHLRLALHARDDRVKGDVVHVQIAAQGQLTSCVRGVELCLIENCLHRGLSGAILGRLDRSIGRGRGGPRRLVGSLGLDQLR